MKERKIIVALSSLSKEDLKLFGQYITSPYININENLIKLYQQIESIVSKKAIKKIPSDETVWSVLYPNTKFDSLKLNRLHTSLVQIFENFIAQREFEKIPVYQSIMSAEIIRSRGLNKFVQPIIQNTARLLDKQNHYTALYYLFSYRIKKISQQLEKAEYSEENMKQLEIFYTIEKLKLFSTLMSWKKMYQLDFELNFMNWVFEKASNEFNHIPATFLFKKIADIYLDENQVEHYFTLRNLMKEYLPLFTKEEQKEVYTTAVSYCINKINNSQFDFSKETFEVYKETVEKGFVIINNEVSVSDFRNIVVAALRVAEYDWTEKFIEEYADFLHPNFRDNAVFFSLARLEMYRKNYGKVLEQLQRINFADVWYNLGAKTIQVAAYYELKEFDTLESLLHSFKIFINREKSLTKDRKATYLNLIKYTKRIIMLLPSDKDKIAKLKDEIVQTKGIVTKTWLLEKVEELEKNKRK